MTKCVPRAIVDVHGAHNSRSPSCGLSILRGSRNVPIMKIKQRIGREDNSGDRVCNKAMVEILRSLSQKTR